MLGEFIGPVLIVKQDGHRACRLGTHQIKKIIPHNQHVCRLNPELFAQRNNTKGIGLDRPFLPAHYPIKLKPVLGPHRQGIGPPVPRKYPDSNTFATKGLQRLLRTGIESRFRHRPVLVKV